MALAANSTGNPRALPKTAEWVEPGILLTRPPLVHTLDAVRAYYDAIREELVGTGGKFVLITDARHLNSMPDAIARREHAARSEELTAAFPGRCVHSVTVVEGAVIRATITAILWIVGDAARPHQVTGTLDEAMRIARSKV